MISRWIFGQENWSLEVWYKSLIVEGMQLLHLTTQNAASESTYDATISIENVLLATFGIFVNLVAEFYFIFMLLALGVSSLTIWLATSNFIDGLPVHQPGVTKYPPGLVELKSLEHIKRNYRILMDLVDEINSVWSGFGLFVTVNLTAWLSADLNQIWRSTNYAYSMYNSCMFIYLSLAMILSAESFRKASCIFKKYISLQKIHYQNIKR